MCYCTTGSNQQPINVYVRSPDRFPNASRSGYGDVICATSIYNLYHKLLPADVCQQQISKFNDSYTAEPSYGHTYLFVRLDKDVETTAINTWYFGDFDLGAFSVRTFSVQELLLLAWMQSNC